MPINLNGSASKARQQLVQAFKGEDAEALEAAFAAFQTEVANDLMEQFNDAMESHDEQVLAQRGFPQLTQRETKYFESIITALKSPNPKQELARLATIGDGTGATDVKDRMMPETIIDEILKDIEETHELLAVVKATNVGYVTTWLRNKHPRQLAVWGAVESAITKEITSSFDIVQVTQGKLSCYAAVSQDMLNLGPRWMAAYVRTTLGEAMACGMENGIVNGRGPVKSEPIGMARDIKKPIDPANGYALKDAYPVFNFSPAAYGNMLALLSKTDDGKVKRSVGGLTLVCNLTDSLTKIMPATTVLTVNGTYVNGLFPVPTRVVTSEFVDNGKAILFLPDEYDLLIGGNRGIEYSDEYQFLEDNRVFKVVQYAFGLPRWNTSALLLDISDLEPGYVNVAVKGTVSTTTGTGISDATVAAATKASYWGHNTTDLQTGLYVADGKIYGTLKKVTSGQLVNDWGEGYFMALKWTCDAGATSLKVGMVPSMGAGFQECLSDPDRDGVMKVTDKDIQKFVIITANSNESKTQTYDLSNLVFEE